MFDSFSDKLNSAFSSLRGKGTLKTDDVDQSLKSISDALLDGDVALEVVDLFIENIKDKAYEITKSKTLNPSEQIVKLVNEELINILGGGVDRPLEFAKKGPTVILLAGLQGSGKTTFAGKLGKFLKADGHTPMLVAADLQRPNAVQQLQTVGENAGVEVFAPDPGVTSESENNSKKGLLSRIGIGSKESNPVEVAREGIKYAADKYYDIVIIDTAGRLAVDEELMDQVKNISDAVNPNEVLFVIDSMLGQDAARSAKAFSEKLDLTGIVLTKVDGDSRGGAALSVVSITGKPILFASSGEKLDDIETFHPDRIAGRILNMGDILSLIEKAESTLTDEEEEKLTKKLTAGKGFDFDDFLIQMNQIKKMGSLKSIASMIPGVSQKVGALDSIDEGVMDVYSSIVHSMTPFERSNPKSISGTRRARIAKGSGRSVRQVNELLDRFKMMSKMMKNMGPAMLSGQGQNDSGEAESPNPADLAALANGGVPNLNQRSNSKKKSKKKKKFGNPAKQAAWERQHNA
ncbi:MAG: signal recognition particle protein [Bifidobacteriaceae bacterium]|jgi:signal recognition particle subunit SRP54|nr:signal recognition particle protein [Bifidobacteriaceae bacterium]